MTRSVSIAPDAWETRTLATIESDASNGTAPSA
jgi:hypothetical protein